MKSRIIFIFLVFSFTNLCLAYSENINLLKLSYEEQYKHVPSFKNLEKLIEIYLISSKYVEAEKIILNFNNSNLGDENLANYYLLLAKTYKYQLKNDLSIYYFNKCSKLLFKLKNKEKIIFYYIELLEFYRKTADFERAFKLIDKLLNSYKIESIQNDRLLNFFYHRYAAVLNERARGSESIPLSLKAIELAKNNKNKYTEAISYNELGFTYKNLLNNKKSIDYYEKAYQLWLSIGCYPDAIHAKYNKNIVISHNNLLPSFEQIKLNENLINLIDSLKIDYPKSKIYALIEFHHVNLKNWERAYNFRLKADTAVQIELENVNFKILNDLKEKYENEQLAERNKTIKKIAFERKEKLKLANTRFWWIFTYSSFALFLSIILFVLWRKNKIKSKKLLAQNIQKTFLIQEIHHRVKNNLQFVKSILTMQESVQDLTAKETIEDIYRRIDAMSMVHEMLYSENDQIHLSIKTYLHKLIEVSKSLYKTEKEIEFNLDIIDSNFSLEESVAIGMICSELLANSVKHVFSKNVNPTFSISLKLEGQYYILTVEDNGIENEVLIEEKRYKLGMRLIHIFAKQLNAEIIINYEKKYSFFLKFKTESSNFSD